MIGGKCTIGPDRIRVWWIYFEFIRDEDSYQQLIFSTDIEGWIVLFKKRDSSHCFLFFRFFFSRNLYLRSFQADHSDINEDIFPLLFIINWYEPIENLKQIYPSRIWQIELTSRSISVSVSKKFYNSLLSKSTAKKPLWKVNRKVNRRPTKNNILLHVTKKKIVFNTISNFAFFG